jgi:hypothetical protein
VEAEVDQAETVVAEAAAEVETDGETEVIPAADFELKPGEPDETATVETEPEESEILLPEADDDEEEEVVIKKKSKKAKAAPKHLSRIELDDEPLVDNDGYFFSDLLDANAKTEVVSADQAEAVAAIKPEVSDELISGGFTIGDLLAKEVAKKSKKGNKTKKGV